MDVVEGVIDSFQIYYGWYVLENHRRLKYIWIAYSLLQHHGVLHTISSSFTGDHAMSSLSSLAYQCFTIQ